MWLRFACTSQPGIHFTKFMSLWSKASNNFRKYWSDQVTILHMSWQLSCHDMCKFVTWLSHKIKVKTTIYYKISIKCSQTICEMHPDLLVAFPPMTSNYSNTLSSFVTKISLINKTNSVVTNTLTHNGAWTKWLTFCRQQFQINFHNETCFDSNFHWICLTDNNSALAPLMLGQHLRCQAITWTNDDLLNWWIYKSPGLSLSTKGRMAMIGDTFSHSGSLLGQTLQRDSISGILQKIGTVKLAYMPWHWRIYRSFHHNET